MLAEERRYSGRYFASEIRRVARSLIKGERKIKETFANSKKNSFNRARQTEQRERETECTCVRACVRMTTKEIPEKRRTIDEKERKILNGSTNKYLVRFSRPQTGFSWCVSP